MRFETMEQTFATGSHKAQSIIATGLLILFLCLLFPLSASAHDTITHTGSGRIFGLLLNGTHKNAAVVGQKVILQMAKGNTASDLTSVTTDIHGAFSFNGLDTSKTINYAVYTNYEGAQYFTDLIDLSTKVMQQVNLTVYEATTSAANIAVVRATVLMQEPDAKQRIISVSEIYAFKNLGITTYVGSLSANGGKPNALRFSLPHNAGKVSLGSGFNGYQAIQVDPGFASDAAIPPGDSELDFSFQIPYTTSQYDFGYTAVYPTVQLSMYVPQDIHASSSGLNSAGLVSANKTPYHLFQGQVLAPGIQVHVELDGLPASSPANSSSSDSSGLWGWIVIALLVMLVILGITWMLYRSTRRSAAAQQSRRNAGQRRREKSVEGKQDASSRQEPQQALLQQLLELDKAFEAGKIKKAEYQERRAKTKARLRTLMRTETEEKTAKGR